MSVDHYENFPVASWLCPAPLRPAVTAIYWYARTADDLADEGCAPPAERLADLAAFRGELQRMAHGQPPTERWAHVFNPLARAVAMHHLPLNLLEDLLSAFEQDVVRQRYADRADLLDYCRRSANPVGRLLLHLYGVHAPAALARSDAICTALQLINFWQDLGVDLPRNRVYLPRADCLQHGLQPDALAAGERPPALSALVAELVQWAGDLMRKGAPLVHELPGRVGWELRLVVQGGLRVLDHIRHLGYDTAHSRPTLGLRDAPLIAWRACRMARPNVSA